MDVRCNYCGNDTMCNECQKAPGKENEFEHICFECYKNNKGEIAPDKKDKTHICIPPEELSKAYERFLEDTTRRAFQELWEAEKKKMRELSKQELAEASFFEGARFMYSFMQQMSVQGEEGHSHEGHEHGHSHEGHEHEHGKEHGKKKEEK